MWKLTRENGEQILLGGWFLGGGGGGLPQGGREVLEQVLRTGEVWFADPADLADDALIVTASLVGSPASEDSCVAERHYREVYARFLREQSAPIAAFTTNEAGAHSITNGWAISAITGIPMVDAACNGRAHPTGVMGAMGLNTLPGYRALQTAAGGAGEREIAISVTGTVESTSTAVRQAAVQAGGYVTVLRNPTHAVYFRQNAAMGAVSQARRVGEVWQKAMTDLPTLVAALSDLLDCRLLGCGTIESVDLRISGGFDVGAFTVKTGHDPLEVTFMNEYMTAEQGDRRLSTFPELIAVIDTGTLLPVCSAQLKAGMEVAVVTVPSEKLSLGRGMFLPELFAPSEQALGKPICPYIFK